MKKILSIDGGGIRGIIPGQVLVALEEKLQKKSNNPNARIADYFDFFAGTSTGGILTCIYLCPDEKDPARPRFSAKDAVDLYVSNGGKIFDADIFQKIKSANGTLDEKFNARGLENCLSSYFGELKLSELLKPCIITAYDIEQRQTKFFAQHDHLKKGPGSDYFVRDVCRATSAAPTYFETALIESLSGVRYALADGGVFANNPALCAYSEVRNSRGLPTAQDMFIVSIGTGSEVKPYNYDQAKNWGAIGWIRPVIDIMMSGASETTHYHLTKMFSAHGNKNNYVRIQPTNIWKANFDMDDASHENIAALVEAGTKTAEDCPELDFIVDRLLDDKDAVVFD